MTTVRLYRAGLATTTPPATTVRLYRAGLATAAASTGTKVRLYRAGVTSGTSQGNAPAVSVSPAVVSVEAGSVVILTGTDSDPDGTVVARAWKRDGATVSTATSYSFTAPVSADDQTLTVTYSATDNQGNTSAVTVAVTVRRATITRLNADGSRTGFVIHSWSVPAATLTPATSLAPSATLTPQA